MIKLLLNTTSKSVRAAESADGWLVSQFSETISLTQEQADVINETTRSKCAGRDLILALTED